MASWEHFPIIWNLLKSVKMFSIGNRNQKSGKNDWIKDYSSTVYYTLNKKHSTIFLYVQGNVHSVLFSPSWVSTLFPWAQHRYNAKARMGQGQYRTFDLDNWFRKSVQGHYTCTSSTHEYSFSLSPCSEIDQCTPSFHGHFSVKYDYITLQKGKKIFSEKRKLDWQTDGRTDLHMEPVEWDLYYTLSLYHYA